MEARCRTMPQFANTPAKPYICRAFHRGIMTLNQLVTGSSPGRGTTSPLARVTASSDHGLTQEPRAFLQSRTRFEPKIFKASLQQVPKGRLENAPSEHHQAGSFVNQHAGSVRYQRSADILSAGSGGILPPVLNSPTGSN